MLEGNLRGEKRDDGVCYLTEKRCQSFQRKQCGVEGYMRRGSFFLVAWLYLYNQSDLKPFSAPPQWTGPWSAGGFDLLSSGLDTIQHLGGGGCFYEKMVVCLQFCFNSIEKPEIYSYPLYTYYGQLHVCMHVKIIQLKKTDLQLYCCVNTYITGHVKPCHKERVAEWGVWR